MTRKPSTGSLVRQIEAFQQLREALSITERAKTTLQSQHPDADELHRVSQDLRRLCIKIDEWISSVRGSVRRPTTISEDDPHALERLIERHPDTLEATGDLSLEHARLILLEMMGRAQFLDWNPSDLDGLGQATWIDDRWRIKFTTDGNGLVRTVLPKPPGRCGYIVDNYTNDPDERICGNTLPCKRHP